MDFYQSALLFSFSSIFVAVCQSFYFTKPEDTRPKIPQSVYIRLVILQVTFHCLLNALSLIVILFRAIKVANPCETVALRINRGKNNNSAQFLTVLSLQATKIIERFCTSRPLGQSNFLNARLPIDLVLSYNLLPYFIS